MPQAAAVEQEAAGQSPAAILASKLRVNKDLAGGIHLGNEVLLSDIKRYISTQSAMLDYAIGRNGIPTGTPVCIVGREGSGKSLLAYHILAETQRIGGIGVLLDTEQRFTKDRAEAIGMNLDELIVIDGLTLEKCWEAIEKCIEDTRKANSDIPLTIVLDSLAGSVTEKRLEAEVGSSVVANKAKFINDELPRLKLKLAKYDIAFIIVNQLRSKIHADPRKAMYEERNKVMGKDQSMIAEWTLLYECALILRLNSMSPILNKEGDKKHPIGVTSKFEVRKSGISPREGWSAEVDIDFMHGFDRLDSKFQLLEQLEVITGGSAGWYKVPGEEKSFKRSDFQRILDSHPELETLLQAAPESWQDS